MAEDVPVPAEAARRVAISASTRISGLRKKGYKGWAERIERAVAKVLSETQGKDGEFVSVDSYSLEVVTGNANTMADAEVIQYVEASSRYLKQYNVW